MIILKIILKKYKTHSKNQPQSRAKTNACLEFLSAAKFEVKLSCCIQFNKSRQLPEWTLLN